MASLPVVITQDEFIDLTMENTDDENTEKSLDGNATTKTKKGKRKQDSQESTPKKKLIQKDLHDFLTIPKKFPKKKVVSPPKKKKRSTKTPKKDPLNKPKNNLTLTQDFLKPAK